MKEIMKSSESIKTILNRVKKFVSQLKCINEIFLLQESRQEISVQ